MLKIKELYAGIKNKLILNGINLEIKPGEIHAIMGPNGSGKSTFSSVLAGHKNYDINAKIMKFKNKDLKKLKPEERAGEGMFISFQHAIEIPGITNNLFLRTSINSIRKYKGKKELDLINCNKYIQEKMKLFNISKDFLDRLVNVGFSGGEKKINDILQINLLNPVLCILDEIDSGLDIDALKLVAKSINSLCNGKRSFIIITHYQRILNYVHPHFVHILSKGKIIKNGDFSLVKKLEEKGYGWITKKK